MWPFFHTDRSLLKVLLKTGAQAVRELVADLYPDVRIGPVYTVRTFGRDLGLKPRAHLVMTKGGLKDAAWVEIDHLIWMKRWLETHRLRKAARQAMQPLQEARSLQYR